MEKVTFTRKADSKYVDNGKSVGVRSEEWKQIKDISDLSGETMTEVATKLISFALQHVSWDK